MMIERSVAAEARMDVSVWLKESAVIVSIEFGQDKVNVGADEGRERS